MVEEGSILHVGLPLLLSAVLAHIEVPCWMAQPAGSGLSSNSRNANNTLGMWAAELICLIQSKMPYLLRQRAARRQTVLA